MYIRGASACVRRLRLFTCVQYNQLATPRRHVAYNLSFWMKWSVFMIMTGMGNSFLTTVSKLITLDTPGACISCVRFPNLWSWPSPPRNITTPPSDTTTTIPPSDRYIPGRSVATPEQLWGRIAAQEVLAVIWLSILMDLVVTVCWWTWQLYNFGKVNTKVLTGQTVKRNRWRDHQCHYGQLSWYWDEEWVTCRWSMICA